MSIKKQYYKTKPYVKVTLTLPKEAAPEAKKVTVAGDFNGWNKTSDEMTQLKNGSFKYTTQLEQGKEYQFRYLIDGNTWENDWEADKYVGGGASYDENSVIDLN